MRAADIRAARERIAAHVLRTPIQRSRTLSRLTGAELLLKCENLQTTGSFKVRGALHRLLALDAEERRRGVIAASAGNHAQGVAFAARALGVQAQIVMPATAAIAKVEATRGYGAEVVLQGADYAAAFEHARALSRNRGPVLIPAFDDRRVIAGQGTVGLEILEDVPDVEAIVVPVGGGGLAAGIATAVSEAARKVAVFGVQAEHTSTLVPSLRAGRRVRVSPSPSIADGLATSAIGAAPWALLRHRLARAVTVGETETAKAILLLLERCKLVVEGAGAVGLAACLGPLRSAIRGKRVVVVLSGGNIDVNLLDRILTLGLVAEGRVLRFETVLLDRPGARASLAAVVGDLGANIRQIHHDRARIGLGPLETVVTVELETRSRTDVPRIVARLRDAGYGIDTAGLIPRAGRRAPALRRGARGR